MKIGFRALLGLLLAFNVPVPVHATGTSTVEVSYCTALSGRTLCVAKATACIRPELVFLDEFKEPLFLPIAHTRLSNCVALGIVKLNVLPPPPPPPAAMTDDGAMPIVALEYCAPVTVGTGRQRCRFTVRGAGVAPKGLLGALISYHPYEPTFAFRREQGELMLIGYADFPQGQNDGTLAP